MKSFILTFNARISRTKTNNCTERNPRRVTTGKWTADAIRRRGGTRNTFGKECAISGAINHFAHTSGCYAHSQRLGNSRCVVSLTFDIQLSL